MHFYVVPTGISKWGWALLFEKGPSMKFSMLKCTTAMAVVLALTSVPAIANDTLSIVSEASLENAGRNIMRTVDGGIVATYAVPQGNISNLIFARTLDNGASWNQVKFPQVAGDVKQAAVDSNFKGSYVAFTEEIGGKLVSKIAYTPAPFASHPGFTVSDAVTPANVVPQDIYIQASRKGWGQFSDQARETVAYGWQDANTNALYVGVSFDGETFPVAQKILDDPFAASGPAVAVRGKYVVASYQTTNPDIVPGDVAPELRGHRTYPAWIESMDGGVTWSDPKPVFGRSMDEFPVAEILSVGGEPKKLRLAGGTSLPNSPTLNWGSSRGGGVFAELNRRTRGNSDRTSPTTPAQEELKEQQQVASVKDNESGLTFVQTSMLGLGADGTESEVSIVSFRKIEPGAPWTHVVAHNKLTTDPGLVDATTSTLDVEATQFQYSALIDTKIRATSYKELDKSTGSARLVVAVSTDTGMTFAHHISFGEAELEAHGISNFGEAGIFAASQCLYEDRDGEVYVDLLVSEADEMRFISLPTGVNAAKLREKDHAALMVE